MSAIPTIVPVSELRRDASELLNTVTRTSEPIVITQRGYARAVLQDIEAYQQMQRKLEIAELLACGEMEIQEGKGIPAEVVMARLNERATEIGTRP
jgi:prevent-host-death family protein